MTYNPENLQLHPGIIWRVQHKRTDEPDDERPAVIDVGTTTDGDDILQCPACGWMDEIDAWDCVGAEPGGLFCVKCGTECC